VKWSLCAFIPGVPRGGCDSLTSLEQNRLENGKAEGKKTTEPPQEPKKKNLLSRLIDAFCATLAIVWHFLADHLHQKRSSIMPWLLSSPPAKVKAVAATAPIALQLAAVWIVFLTINDTNAQVYYNTYGNT